METTGWRSDLSMVDRYEIIQQIKLALETTDPARRVLAQKDASALENQAYENATSKEHYDRLCKSAGASEATLESGDEEDVKQAAAKALNELDSSDSGLRIGAYKNCKLIASGVTSEVYKSRDRALKVIVETRPMEPHSPSREAKILATLKPLCIPLLETFRDQEQRFVLVFPYMPFTLADVLEKGPIPVQQLRTYFRDLFGALTFIHSQGIVHRDIKPSALLLESPDGMSWLSDFGTAWHPQFSRASEPSYSKILDIGTGPYRAPEVLFGDKSYGPPVDMWAAGTMLAECCRSPPSPLFESRAAHEDGNQLGLILSIFKTLGTPTPETWPEALKLKTPPFEMYEVYDGKEWAELLPDAEPEFRSLVRELVRYDGSRITAEDALGHSCLVGGNASSTSEEA